MTEITLWLLIAVSNGGHGSGQTTVIDRFASKATCEAARVQVFPETAPTVSTSRWARCVQAKVAR